MSRIKKFYQYLIRITKGIQIYGLVGKAGTGKSFRAQLVAAKYNIDYIIDDGLLIQNQQIVAGKSAKQAKGPYGAVKIALFDEPIHAAEVRKALKKEKNKRILILGTSIRMIHKIAKKLHLNVPKKIIKIEDIATKEEIEKARHSRHNEGKHIIPVPAIEVKRKHAQIFFNSIKIFIKRKFNIFKKEDVFEKSIVQPVFSDTNRGKVTISEEAITQMVMHCIKEFNPKIKVTKITLIHQSHFYKINISLRVAYGIQLSGLIHNLQNYIIENIEKFTGLIIKTVNITVDTIS